MKKALLIVTLHLVLPAMAADDKHPMDPAIVSDLKKLKVGDSEDVSVTHNLAAIDAWHEKAAALLSKYGVKDPQPRPEDVMRNMLTLLLTNYHVIVKRMSPQGMQELSQTAVEGLRFFPTAQTLPLALDLMSQISEFDLAHCPPAMAHLMGMMERDREFLQANKARFDLLSCRVFKLVEVVHKIRTRVSPFVLESYTDLVIDVMPGAFRSNAQAASELMKKAFEEVVQAAQKDKLSFLDQIDPVLSVFLASHSFDPVLFKQFAQFALREYPDKVMSTLLNPKTSQQAQGSSLTPERTVAYILDQLADPLDNNLQRLVMGLREMAEHSSDLSAQARDIIGTKLPTAIFHTPSLLTRCVGFMLTSDERANEAMYQELLLVMRGLQPTPKNRRAQDYFFREYFCQQPNFVDNKSLDQLTRIYVQLKADGHVLAMQEFWQLLISKDKKVPWDTPYLSLCIQQMMDFFDLTPQDFAGGNPIIFDIFLKAIQTKPNNARHLHTFYETAKQTGFWKHFAGEETIILLSRRVLSSQDTSLTERSEAFNNWLERCRTAEAREAFHQEFRQGMTDPTLGAYGELAFQFAAVNYLTDHRKRIPLQHQFLQIKREHPDISMPELYTCLENCFFDSDRSMRALNFGVKKPIIGPDGRIYWARDRWIHDLIHDKPSRHVKRLFCSDGLTGFSLWETDVERGDTDETIIALGKDHLYVALPNGAISAIDKITGDRQREIRVDPENEVGIAKIAETPSGSLFIAYGYDDDQFPRCHQEKGIESDTLFLACLDLQSGGHKFNVPLKQRGLEMTFRNNGNHFFCHDDDIFSAEDSMSVFNTRGPLLEFPGQKGIGLETEYQMLAGKLLKVTGAKGVRFSLTCQSLDSLQEEWTLEVGSRWLSFATDNKGSKLFVGWAEDNTLSCIDLSAGNAGKKLWQQKIVQGLDPQLRELPRDLFLSKDESTVYALDPLRKIIFSFDAVTGAYGSSIGPLRTSDVIASYIGSLPSGEIVLK